MRATLAFLVLLLAAAPTAPAAGSAVWPLDLETRYLTSNFMERRPGRWHAGLDLKTRSRAGFAVRAVDAGWVSRVRAEAGAYGRAVYVTHPSGRTTVYAHLERFADRILERVEADRARTGRYRCRLQFAPGEFPVAAGEVLGLSGQSGTLGPHLHFEVRDAAQRPLDPLAHGFAVDDTIAPLITGVTAHPVPVPNPASAGDPLPAVARGVRDPAGLSGVTAPLVISGAVAFSAAISDRSDRAGHILEPWLIEVRLDGETVYECRNETFAFAENNLQRLEWCDIEGFAGETILREHWLFRREGVELAGRAGGLWHLGLAPGEHRLEIIAVDRSGGRAAVTVPLTVEAAGAVPVSLAGWDAVTAHLEDDHGNRLTPFAELRAADGPPPPRRLLDPAAGDPVLAPTVLWTVPWERPPGVREKAVPGLTPLDWGAWYLAADWPLDGSLAMAVAAPAVPAAWVFRLERERWRRVGPLLEEDGAAFFMLSERGLHRTFLDEIAPWIDPAAPEVAPREPAGVPGVTLPRWQTVPVAVVDEGTGVDPATITATFDGSPLIVEPDLLRDRVLVTVPDGTAPGLHQLRLEAADRAGNRAAALLEVRVAAAAPGS